MDTDFIAELFASFRPVTVKSMFGGLGIYVEGLMFGIAFEEVIYLRVDAASLPDFERESSVPFVYPLAKNHVGRPSRNFWRLPERLYDDPDELAAWATRSLEIARHKKTAPRAGVGKKPAAKKPIAKKLAAKKPAAKKPALNKKAARTPAAGRRASSR